jgi:hypothetical protein
MLLHSFGVDPVGRVAFNAIEGVGEVEDRMGNPGRFDFEGFSSELVFRICFPKVRPSR